MASGERKKIGKYEVLDILGRGGMGIVYKAVDPGIGRAVAIKMTTGAVGEDPEMLQRFSREAQSVGQLQHPNIVTVYDLGVEGRNPYLVMELLEGESLEALERSRRSLSLEEKLDITMQICAGVQYAHRRGVMHRDIKPANIMILKDGTAKIVDFGIARMGMQKLTRPGQLVGSFAYMSPEQINAAPVDARTDIFSIGVLLFELVAGRLPFEGKDTGEMLLKILHQAPPSLRELAPDCPAELEGMVQRALAKNVEERYQSAEDLGFDLGHVLEKWRRERVSEYLAGAETAAAQRQWGRAKEQLLQVLKRDRQNSRANLRLREVQQEMQKQQRGERARELQAQAEHALAQADVVEALRYLNEAVELDGGGNPEIVQFRDSIQQQKTREDQLHALRQRAEMAQDAGDLEAARQAVEDGLALDGKNTDFRALQVAITRELAGRDQQKRVQEFLGEARKQISSRRFTAALEALRQAEALDPTVPVVRELIVLASTGQRQERRRLELEALTARIEEALVKEDYGTAAARIDQGLRSYPEDRGLLKLQAVVNKQREETEKRAYLERQTAQARRLLDGGQGAEALTVLRAALAKYPGEASLEALLAMVEESIERARKEQETREVIQSARQALRRKAYAIAIAILEEARKKRPSSEYDELLQFAQNEAENQARRQKIDAVAEAARRLTAEDKYPEAMALLQATVQEIPDQELQIILADIKRHVDEFQAGVEKALATAERLLRQDRYAEAIKLLESQSAQYGNAPRLQQTLAAIRQRQQTVHAVSVLKEEVRNALAQADTAAAQRLCQQFRQSDQATETALVEIALLEKEIAAQQTEAANRQLEMALRDARLLVTVHSPQAALSVLETVASALPFAALELQQRFQALQTAARNTQPSLTPPSSPVAVSTTAHSTPPHSTAPISTTAISTAPISTTAIPTEDDSEETQLADPDRLQSMLLEVAQIAGNYRHHTKLQSEIYSLKQQLTEKISILRESNSQLRKPGKTPPPSTATSLTPSQPSDTSVAPPPGLPREAVGKPEGSTIPEPAKPPLAEPPRPQLPPPSPVPTVHEPASLPPRNAPRVIPPAPPPRMNVPGNAPAKFPALNLSQLITWMRGGRGNLALAAALAIVLMMVGLSFRGKKISKTLPPPSTSPLSVHLHTSPPGATIRVNDEVRGVSDLQLSLPAGKYQIEADLVGYQPGNVSFEAKAGSPNSVDLMLQPALPMVKLSSDTGAGRVTLDDLPAINLAVEQPALEGIAAGDHKLKFDGPQGSASFSFSTSVGTPPAVVGPIVANRVMAVVVANLGSRVHVYCSEPDAEVRLDDQPSAKLSPDGLELTSVPAGAHELLIKLADDQYKLGIDVGAAPSLTTFLESGKNIGNLLVTTREDGVKVFVNGKPRKGLTRGGQLRIQNLTPGEYTVAVSKPGFQNVAQHRTVIRKGEQSTVSFTLTPLPRVATLSIRGGAPGTQVFVDDKLEGTVLPDGTLNLPNIAPGDHAIVLRRDRFEPRRLQKHFTAGAETAITAPELQLQASTGELRITFSPPDAQVTLNRAGDPPAKATNGATMNLPPGTYTITARTADDMTRTKVVEVVAGQSKGVDLPLAPNGMSKWDDPSGWKLEQNAYVHKGGGFVLFGTTPTSGTFSFSAALQKGKRLQWVLNYTAPTEYVLFQMDENFLYRSTVRNGAATGEIKIPHKIQKKAFQAIRIHVAPNEIVSQIKEGGNWLVLDRFSAPGTNFTLGKFGFYLPGKDQVAIMNFNHYAELDTR